MRLPSPRRLRLLPALALLAATGCTGTDAPATSPAPSPTALDAHLVTGVEVPRSAFCDRVPAEALAQLLGGEPSDASSYGPGERRKLAPGLRDVVHEFSCTFRRGSRVAHAWIFAQPVDRTTAADLLRERRRTPGCTAAGPLAFGEPGLVQRCRDGRRARVSMAGLFGDAWVTCEVTDRVPAGRQAAELSLQAQRWCATAVLATGG